MKMTEEEVKDLLVKTNAIMNGHFLLTSGLHSPHYVEKFNVLQHPKYTQQLCEAMAEKFKDADIETVVGPMTGQGTRRARHLHGARRRQDDLPPRLPPASG